MHGTGSNRREFLKQSAVASAGIALAGCARTMSGTMGQAGGDVVMPVTSLPSPTNRQGSYADINGARIFYQVAGQGTPLLLIHGYPLSGALFARNRDALASRFRVITLDQRGYGKSQAPGVPDMVNVYAKDALDLLTHLGAQQAIIGGHSMGGAVTLAMYQMAPERFRGMMLIDTTASAASPMEAGLWHGFAEYAKTKGVDQMYADALIKDMLTGATRTQQMAQVDYLGAVVKEASVDGAVGGAMALANRPDAMGKLGQIKVPTLVFVGVEDSLYPVKTARMMQQAIPGSKLATIPGAAHAAVFEMPEASNRAILDWAAGM